MNVDIYIREVNGKREIRIPWLPDEINFESGEASVASYDIMNLGEVIIPTGVGLKSFSWESIFPGSGRTDTGMLRGSWKKPSYYDDLLNDWKANRTKLNILVTGYPFNKDVYIINYTGKASGGFGDISYSVTFKEARTIKITSTKVATTTKKSTFTVKPRTSYEPARTYTIKSGDTLWGIAKKHLGDGTKWKTLYNLNRIILDQTADKRWKAAGIKTRRGSEQGHWIFPGTVIRLRE